MLELNRLSLNRRLALGSLLSLPFATRAWAEDKVSLPPQACTASGERVTNTLYEFDVAGRPVEWDYPSGKPTANGLRLKGLGLQKTNSVKHTSSGFTDTSALADRFLNMGTWVDWHPTSLWALQFGAKAAIALNKNEDVVADTSISDEFFAFQRVGGVYPCALTKLRGDRTFDGVMQADTEYYMIDYQVMDTLIDNDTVSDNDAFPPEQKRRYGYQPKALFAVANKELTPVAIQVQRGLSKAMVRPGDQKWEIAKFIFQNADLNYHQLVGHFGRTHLYMEAIAVSTGIALPRDIHPLSRLLRPHFEGTINITDFASTDLLNISPQSNHGGVLDHNITGTMASNIKLIAEEVFGLYDKATLRLNPSLTRKVENLFNENILPRDLVTRGVGHYLEETISVDPKGGADLIDIVVYHAHPGIRPGVDLGFSYPYLEDSCQIWNAITDWVCRYVAAYYNSDDDVQNDCELQAWAKTIVEGGKISGFGEYLNGHTLEGQIQTRSYLVQALSNIIFTASVQHSAVNFPQAQHTPSMPIGIYHDFFEGGSADVSDYLPNEAHFRAAMETASLLSASQYTTLGKYHENTSAGKKLRSVKDYFDNDQVNLALKQFIKTLEVIETHIEDRKGTYGGQKYEYLLPSKIPQSVNV